jgi:hypothetical protein
MSIINKNKHHDQLYCRHNSKIDDSSSDAIHAEWSDNNISDSSSLELPERGEIEKRNPEREVQKICGCIECGERVEEEESLIREDLDSTKPKKGEFHRVPKSFIKELGVEAAAVLFGFSLILKNHKKNKRDDVYWYYETLDNLIEKRWSYLKKTSLYNTILLLRDREYIQISQKNKKLYDRTMHYSMFMSRINQVMEDKHLVFGTLVANRVGVLGALLYHNIEYNVRNSRCERKEVGAHGLYKPRIAKLAEIFAVSESTIKRQLTNLIKEDLLTKGPKQGYYSLPDNLTGAKSGSNLNEEIEKMPVFCAEKTSSNLNKSSSNLNKSRSFLNESRSNPNNNTLYETNKKHIGKQMRSASRVFLKKEENEESDACFVADSSKSKKQDFQNIDKAIYSNSLQYSEIDGDLNISDYTGFSLNSEIGSFESKTVLERLQLASPIDHSGLFEKSQESRIIDKQTAIGSKEVEHSNSLAVSSFSEESKNHTILENQKEESRGSSSILEKAQNLQNSNCIFSFGRKIELLKDSRFSELLKVNQEFARELKEYSDEEIAHVRETLLRLGVLFAESLDVQKRIEVLSQNSPDRVLNLIFLDAFSFLEDKCAEFSMNGEILFSSNNFFPLFPFAEIVCRGMLLFKKIEADAFEIDEFSLYSIFEATSFALFDRTDMSPEVKSTFFNFLVLRNRMVKIDNKTSRGKALDINIYLGTRLASFSGYSSEAEFVSLVEFFTKDQNISAEEVFFKYLKCVEWRISVSRDSEGYEKRWHALNFRDISQFLNFYSQISTSIEYIHPEYISAWQIYGYEDSYNSIENSETDYSESLEEDNLQEQESEDLSVLKQYFLKVKRNIDEGYCYISTPSKEDDFRAALEICKEYDLTPEDLVDLAVELLAHNSHRLSSVHLRGGLVRKFLVAEVLNNSKNCALGANENLPLDRFWDHYETIVKLYENRGEPREDVLFDSSLKFHAWFRILATEKPCPRIIEKYKHIAIKELDYRIKRFIRRNGLDLSRICD